VLSDLSRRLSAIVQTPLHTLVRAAESREQSVRARARVRSTSLCLSGGWLSASVALNSLTNTARGPFFSFLNVNAKARDFCETQRLLASLNSYVTF